MFKRLLYIISLIFLIPSCTNAEEELFGENLVNENKPIVLNFLGDSIIDYWDNLSDFFPLYTCHNYGLTRTGINSFLKNVNTDSLKESICIIEVGTNDMKKVITENSLDQYVKEYVSVLQSLKAKKIFLISLLPRNRAIDKFDYNSYYPEINDRIKNEVTTQIENLVYIDLYNKFLKDGVIDEHLTYDGLHPNIYGYKIIAESLNIYLNEYK